MSTIYSSPYKSIKRGFKGHREVGNDEWSCHCSQIQPENKAQKNSRNGLEITETQNKKLTKEFISIYQQPGQATKTNSGNVRGSQLTHIETTNGNDNLMSTSAIEHTKIQVQDGCLLQKEEEKDNRSNSIRNITYDNYEPSTMADHQNIQKENQEDINSNTKKYIDGLPNPGNYCYM